MGKKLAGKENISQNKSILDFLVKQKDTIIETDSDDDIVIIEKENLSEVCRSNKMVPLKRTRNMKKPPEVDKKANETKQTKPVIPFFEAPSPVLASVSPKKRTGIFSLDNNNKSASQRKRPLKCVNSNQASDTSKPKTKKMRRSKTSLVKESPTKKELEEINMVTVFKPSRFTACLLSQGFKNNSTFSSSLPHCHFLKLKEKPPDETIRSLGSLNLKGQSLPVDLLSKEGNGTSRRDQEVSRAQSSTCPELIKCLEYTKYS